MNLKIALFPSFVLSILDIVYSLTALISIVSNVVVLIVFFAGERQKASKLRPFLVNLALSDILMATTSIPFTYADHAYQEWFFPEFLCYLAQMIPITTVFLTVWTLVIISVERYLVICRGLRFNWVRRHRICLILSCWFMALVIGLFQAFHTVIKDVTRGPKYDFYSHKDCAEEWPNDQVSYGYTTFIFIGSYLIPGIILITIYSRICWHLYRYQGPRPTEAEQKARQQRIKTIRLMIAIVAAFLLSWTPIQLFYFVVWITKMAVIPRRRSQMTTFNTVFILSHWLCNASTFINPILYSFMSESFIEDSRRIWSKASGKSLRGRNNTNSSIIRQPSLPDLLRQDIV